MISSGIGSFVSSLLPIILVIFPGIQWVFFADLRANSKPTTSHESSQDKGDLFGATAVVTEQGVLVIWESSASTDNLGFNVYRADKGQLIRLTREIVPGSVFTSGNGASGRASQPYSWFDRGGSAAVTYYIESVSIYGNLKLHDAIRPALGKAPAKTELTDVPSNSANEEFKAESVTSNQTEYVSPGEQSSTTNGPLEDQWAIAAQSALKIRIRRDGWYRVTQGQMAAAGFNPSVEVKNLQLFVDGREIAIRTSKPNGVFGSGDYVEFYGRGLDIPTSDTRTYYLIAGTFAGKRVRGDIRLDATPALTSPLEPDFFGASGKLWGSWILQFLRGEWTRSELANNTQVRPNQEESRTTAGTESGSKKKVAGKRNRHRKSEYSHTSTTIVAGPSFDYTVERKDRLVYFGGLINGAAENFFGPVISSSPVTQTLSILNPEATAVGPAKLEIALQGINFVSHRISVLFNEVAVGTVDFSGRDHAVKTISIPVAQLNNGSNTITLTPGGGGSASLVDYVRLTYPHALRSDNNSLRFGLRSNQSARIDGFSVPGVRLIDYSDPFAVKVTRAIAEPSGAGYAITVPASNSKTKGRRLLYALPDNQFDQPAEVVLNQPSTLHLSSNGADLVILSHKDFLSAAGPLVSLRQNQGLTVSLIDVEDVFDEFSYGTHRPEAMKDFLTLAAATWSKAPRYVIFNGDASLDPRNYQNSGNFDFVPTKLVDATYSETSSDDWLTDFNGDGIADIPVGRLPVRTLAQANLAISKFVNFAPATVPQSALLVADDPTGYYYNFEQANDQIQALLPAEMAVQRVNRRTDPAAHASVIANFNAGQQLVNYSGHGNVNTWSGTFSSTDASALTNGNKLPFVVVMDCLNGYFQDPNLEGLAEALVNAPAGGAVAAFASSGLTLPDGQHEMSNHLYMLLYGPQSIALGDAIKSAKAETTDFDVRRTWIFFGDPSMKIR